MNGDSDALTRKPQREFAASALGATGDHGGLDAWIDFVHCALHRLIPGCINCYTLRPMKIYTKTGDDGSTGLFGGQRVPKHDPRVSAYGTVDELNSVIGMAISAGGDDELCRLLRARQNELFTLGAMLASGDGKSGDSIQESHITPLEGEIDRLDTELAPLRNFILPGGCELASRLHLARTVCRRAEREVSGLRAARTKDAPRLAPAVKYLNRLSDWLFTVARAANKRAGVDDIPWKKF